MPKIYKEGESQVSIRGVTHYADGDGIIDVPDADFSDSVYARGYVSANGQLAQLARERESAVVAPPSVTNNATRPASVEVAAPSENTKAQVNKKDLSQKAEDK